MGAIDSGLDDEGVYNCQGQGSWSDVLVALFEKADGDFGLTTFQSTEDEIVTLSPFIFVQMDMSKGLLV